MWAGPKWGPSRARADRLGLGRVPRPGPRPSGASSAHRTATPRSASCRARGRQPAANGAVARATAGAVRFPGVHRISLGSSPASRRRPWPRRGQPWSQTQVLVEERITLVRRNTKKRAFDSVLLCLAKSVRGDLLPEPGHPRARVRPLFSSSPDDDGVPVRDADDALQLAPAAAGGGSGRSTRRRRRRARSSSR